MSYHDYHVIKFPERGTRALHMSVSRVSVSTTAQQAQCRDLLKQYYRWVLSLWSVMYDCIKGWINQHIYSLLSAALTSECVQPDLYAAEC